MQRARWFQIVLAVLALVAGQVSAAPAALGVTCARTGEARVVVDRADGSQLAAIPYVESRHHTSDDVPIAPAPAAATCATSAASVASPVILPTPGTLWGHLAPSTTTARPPAGHTPAPPFHPPRAS